MLNRVQGDESLGFKERDIQMRLPWRGRSIARKIDGGRLALGADGIYWAGISQGLIHEIPTCRELMDRIVTDAEAIMRDRLGSRLV